MGNVVEHDEGLLAGHCFRLSPGSSSAHDFSMSGRVRAPRMRRRVAGRGHPRSGPAATPGLIGQRGRHRALEARDRTVRCATAMRREAGRSGNAAISCVNRTEGRSLHERTPRATRGCRRNRPRGMHTEAAPPRYGEHPRPIPDDPSRNHRGLRLASPHRDHRRMSEAAVRSHSGLVLVPAGDGQHRTGTVTVGNFADRVPTGIAAGVGIARRGFVPRGSRRRTAGDTEDPALE